MAPTEPAPPLPPEQVAAACLHLLRLAAAHAQHGVAFMFADTEGLHEQEPDSASLDVMAEVTKILLIDRDRLREKAARALVGQLHGPLVPLFKAAQADPEAMENLEDTVEQRLRELGYVMSPDALAAFRIDHQFIRDQGGPSDAAAQCLGRAALEISKRRVSDARKAGKIRPVLGPLNRYVSLRNVRSYFEQVLATAQAQRLPGALLPLEALDADVYTEALLSRLETSFKERVRADLERAYEEVTRLFLTLLRGENPAPSYGTTREWEEQWPLVREQFRLLASELMIATDGDPEALVEKAREGARWWITRMKAMLDIEPDTKRS